MEQPPIVFELLKLLGNFLGIWNAGAALVFSKSRKLWILCHLDIPVATTALVLSLGCIEKIFLIVYKKELLHPTIKTWRNNQEIWHPKYTCYFDLNPNASALVTLRTG